jgi:hypothetical protein
MALNTKQILATLLAISTATIFAFQPQQQQPQQQLQPSLRHSTTVLYKRSSSSSGGGGGGFGSANSPKQDRFANFPFSGTIRPGQQSPQRKVVAKEILKPNYATSGRPTSKTMLPWMIPVKTQEEIEKMRVAGRMAREILDLAGRAVRVGITTDEIDCLVHDEIVRVRLLLMRQRTCIHALSCVYLTYLHHFLFFYYY